MINAVRGARERPGISGGMLTLCALTVEGLANRYLVWAAFLALLMFRFLTHRGGLQVRLPGGRAYALFMALGMLEGAVAVVNNGSPAWPYCRDAILVSESILYWWISVELAYSCRYDMTRFIRTLFLFFGGWCWYSALANLPAYLSGAGVSGLASERINQWVLALGVYLSIFKPPSVGKRYFGKAADRVLSAGIMLAFLLAFSRTAMVMLACLMLFAETRHYGKMLRLACALMVAVGVAYELMPEIFDDFTNKILHSLSEMNSGRTNWTPADVVQNWRGYEVYETRKYFSQASLWQKLFGEGFGKSLDMGGYAFLVTTENSVPYLHNGYYTALMKLGVTGVALYLAFLAGFWTALGRGGGGSYGKCLGRGVAACMFASSVFVNGMYFGGASLAAYCVCYWLTRQGGDGSAREVNEGGNRLETEGTHRHVGGSDQHSLRRLQPRAVHPEGARWIPDAEDPLFLRDPGP